jgi:hypothetical protein
MMKCWLEEWIDFLFPVEQDESVSDVTREKPLTDDWYALPAQSDIPDFLKAEPAVREAERVVRSRRGGTPLTVKNIKNALNRARRPGGEP